MPLGWLWCGVSCLLPFSIPILALGTLTANMLQEGGACWLGSTRVLPDALLASSYSTAGFVLWMP